MSGGGFAQIKGQGLGALIETDPCASQMSEMSRLSTPMADLVSVYVSPAPCTDCFRMTFLPSASRGCAPLAQ
jgi:hypothetical protein